MYYEMHVSMQTNRPKRQPDAQTGKFIFWISGPRQQAQLESDNFPNVVMIDAHGLWIIHYQQVL